MITPEFVFETLLSTSTELKNQWDTYIDQEYENDSYPTDRLDYVDIGEISRFIVNKFKTQDTKDFELFFQKVEELIEGGDDNIRNLLIVGLLESIQNISANQELEYHTGFNQWLKPLTKKAWDYLIAFWESDGASRIENMKKGLFD